MNYTNNLRELREKHDISLRDLSKQIGLSKTELNYIENGKRDMRVTTLVILAKFYNCDLADIINY